MYSDIRNSIKQYSRDEGGNIAVMFAVTVLLILAVITFAIDHSMRVSSVTRAQSLGDNFALAAASDVRLKGEIPKNKMGGYIGVYTAEELAYEFPGFVDGGKGNVSVEISYNENSQQAITRVTGEFLSILPGISGKRTFPFETISRVNFEQTNLKKPLSVALVVDGSVSMQWDDRRDPQQSNDEFEDVSRTPGAVSRRDALKAAAAVLLDELQVIETDVASSGDDRIIRTGIYPFTDDFDETNAARLDWGTYSNDIMVKLNAIEFTGSTNSAAAMKPASEDMQLEGFRHQSENGETNPIKYTILLSDGANKRTSAVNCRWEPKPAHKHWYSSWYRTPERTGHLYSTTQHGRFTIETTRAYIEQDWTHMSLADGEELEEVCDEQYDNDVQTLNYCKDLGNDGGKVFTIGLGLEPGWYHRNNGDDPNAVKVSATSIGGVMLDRYHAYVSKEASDRAYSMLTKCAQDSGGMFFKANNVEELKEAFEAVGRTVVTDYIRIAN